MSKFSGVRLAMAGLCLGAVVTMGSAPASAEDITYLLPAPLSLPAFGPFVLAQQRGYFKAEGLNVTFQVGNAILTLATLSYLGLGVQSPSVDWGDMIGSGIQFIYDGYWWQIVPPGVAIILVVVAFTMLGDGLRDAFQARDQQH